MDRVEATYLLNNLRAFGKDDSDDEAIDLAIEALQPVEDMGEVSDGYHTFNQLYHQRAVLFATIVNQNKDKAWKSWKHEDGKFCFDKGGEWFVVGVDTPEGSYTYHYEQKYWDMFDCEELDRGKHWDGHTEEDVTRLLSLPPVNQKQVTGKLNNPDDSLVTEESDCCKEQKSKLESDLISRQAVIDYLNKLLDGRFDTGKSAMIQGIRDNIRQFPPVEPPKKVVAQIKVDTEEIVERIEEIVERIKEE